MAGRIPQSFINDLLARIDIVEVIDGRVAIRKAGKDYQGLCPFHNEKSPSFTVVPDKQFYHCFGCGASGTALTFLMEFDRLDFVDAVETLARMAGVEVPREGGQRKGPDHAGLLAALERAEVFFREALRAAPAAIDYLRQRGLTGVVARDFGIGFAPDAWDALRRALDDLPEQQLLDAGLLTRSDSGRIYDRFRGRVMFPIRDTRGRVIGFGGRVMGAAEGPKYLNSPETPVFHKGQELYGLYEARRALRRIDRLLVVEGYMDVVALAQAGIANVVATLGTAATPEHFRKLYRYTEEVICCFDGDNAGRKAAWGALESALPLLGEGRQLKFMFLPEGEDPDSLVRAQGRQAFEAQMRGAQPAIEYLFARLADGLDLHNLDDQARLASLAMPHIERVPRGVLRNLMLRRLEAVTGLDEREIARVVRQPRDDGNQSRWSATSSRSAPVSGQVLPRDQRVHGVAAAGAGADLRLQPGGVLQRRLLGHLLHRPALLLALPQEQRGRLCDHAEPDLLVEVARYINEHPGAEPAEIVGRWSGTPAQALLLDLLAPAIALDEHGLQGEFTDGVTKLLAGFDRVERQRLLAQVRQAPSREMFREFWARRQAGGEVAGVAVGTVSAEAIVPDSAAADPGASEHGPEGS